MQEIHSLQIPHLGRAVQVFEKPCKAFQKHPTQGDDGDDDDDGYDVDVDEDDDDHHHHQPMMKLHLGGRQHKDQGQEFQQ